MKNKTMGLDSFRILAAILVIAIHIFPFSGINENLDFIFTHVICRIGVPFFFMITGYFVLNKAIADKQVLVSYSKRVSLIYLLCIVLYLPINIYAHQFSNGGLMGLLKMIFIDGTFYHLWYFPALILGLWLTFFILKNCGEKNIFPIVMALYIIGLFGDSYYGISEVLPIAKTMYEKVFKIFSYSRNGLFMAPMFLYLGFKAKGKEKNDNINLLKGGIFLFLILMIVEGLILKSFDLQRHDSMYFMLIPLMFCLFNYLLKSNDQNKKLRQMSTVIYVIHPLFIVLLRGGAKVLHLQDVLINNHLISYLSVVGMSLMFSWWLVTICNKVRSGKYGKI